MSKKLCGTADHHEARLDKIVPPALMDDIFREIEVAYRRGFQQGAWASYESFMSASSAKDITGWMNRVASWRFRRLCQGNLHRHPPKSPIGDRRIDGSWR